MLTCADTLCKNTVSCCTQLKKQRWLISTRLTTGAKKRYKYNGVGDWPILYAYINYQGCPTRRYESTTVLNKKWDRNLIITRSVNHKKTFNLPCHQKKDDNIEQAITQSTPLYTGIIIKMTSTHPLWLSIKIKHYQFNSLITNQI